MVCTIFSDKHEVNSIYKNDYEKYIQSIKKKIIETVWEMYCNGYDTFQVNCEYGIPLWTAEIITALKMHNSIFLDIFVPYEEQCKNWSEDKRNRYYECHKNADSVSIVNTHYSKECYKIAEEIMIRKSDIVILFGFSESIRYYSDFYNIPLINPD